MTRSIAFTLLVAVCFGLLWYFRPEPVRTATTMAFDRFTGIVDTCEISYYSFPEHGRQTASGEIYDSLGLTCASVNPIPFGTMICFRAGSRECVAVVTDRMPSVYKRTHPGRKFDVSRAVAESLGIVQRGIATIEIKIIKNNP